jgi:hypothetical protein
MDFLLTAMVCLVLGAPLGLAAAALVGRGPELMSGLFVGYRGLGWPEGVQEEDPPGGWTWHLPEADTGSPGEVAPAPSSAPSPAPEITDAAELTDRQVHPSNAASPELVEGAEAIDRRLVLEPIAGHVRSRSALRPH